LRNQDWVVGWLVKVALNEVRDLSRKTSRAEAIEADVPHPNVNTDLLDLRAALLQLPQRRREALVLFYVADLPIASVAQVMDVSEGTVKAHLSQGRETLRDLLGGGPHE
jgi:RNA polymerase sigma-70 factor, ECF subfamily